MIKWIIIFVIFVIYSVVIFLCGRGFGVEESYSEVKSLKWKVMLLENNLRLLSVEENKDER